MKLYDNDAYRDEFMEYIYLHSTSVSINYKLYNFTPKFILNP